MTHLDLDWAEIAAFLPVFESVSVPARQAFLKFVEPAPFHLTVLGEHRQQLCDSKLVYQLTDGLRGRLPEQYRAVRRALQAMGRAPVYSGSSRSSGSLALDYLREHLTSGEIHRLNGSDRGRPLHLAGKIVSASWVESFLATADEDVWENVINHQRFGREFCWPSEYFAVTQFVVKALLKCGRPLDFAGVAKVTGVPDEYLWKVLYLGCHEMVLMVDLCPDTQLPRVGIWPGIISWCREPERVMPEPTTPSQVFGLPFGVLDVTSLVTMCAVERRRLTVGDGVLFARVDQELKASMVPGPEWLPFEFSTYLMFRSGQAHHYAESLGLVTVTGTTGRVAKPYLEITAGGRAFLAMTEAERLANILRQLGLWPEKKGVTPAAWDVELFHGCFRFNNWAYEQPDAQEWEPFFAAFFAVFRELGAISTAGAVDLGRFLHYVERAHNPWLGEGGDDLVEFFGEYWDFRGGAYGVTAIIRLWVEGIYEFIVKVALPFGLVSVGTDDSAPSEETWDYFDDYPDDENPVNILIKLSSLGRFCFGLDAHVRRHLKNWEEETTLALFDMLAGGPDSGFAYYSMFGTPLDKYLGIIALDDMKYLFFQQGFLPGAYGLSANDLAADFVELTDLTGPGGGGAGLTYRVYARKTAP